MMLRILPDWLNQRVQLPFLVAVITTGCSTVPTAPLVYWSRTIGGFDISTGSGTNAGANISVGYKRDDLAFVPAGVVVSKANGESSFKAIKGVDADKCATDRTCAGADLDALSVFGSFEGRGFGSAGATSASVDVTAANYFSTGIAAQKLAKQLGKAESARQVARCIEVVATTAALLPSADQARARKEGMAACSGE